MTFKWKVAAAGLTDRGRVRATNQDYMLLSPEQDIFIVADGMGGHDAGDVASRLAAQHVRAVLDHGHARESIARVHEALNRANDTLFTINAHRDYPPGAGMGTTLAGVWLIDGKVVVFHVGDCRVYRFRSGNLTALTRDHSVYQVWLDGGSHGPEPKRHLVLRALGPWAKVNPEVMSDDPCPGDLYLICSDGLNGMLEDERLNTFLDTCHADNIESTCEALVAEANVHGGRDNITVVLVSIGASDS